MERFTRPLMVQNGVRLVIGKGGLRDGSLQGLPRAGRRLPRDHRRRRGAGDDLGRGDRGRGPGRPASGIAVEIPRAGLRAAGGGDGQPRRQSVRSGQERFAGPPCEGARESRSEDEIESDDPNWRGHETICSYCRCGLLLALAGAAQAQNLSIATGGTGGVYYPLGGGMAAVLSKNVPGMQATAEVTGGSVANLQLIGTGKPYIALHAWPTRRSTRSRARTSSPASRSRCAR